MPRISFVVVVIAASLLAGCAKPEQPGLFEAREAARMRQADATMLIEQHGGGVAWEDAGANVTVRLADAKIAANLIDALAAIEPLQTLTVINAGVPGEDLEFGTLGTLPYLRYLALRDVELTEDVITWAAVQPRLRELYLIGTDVTDAQLKTLAAIDSLRRIVITGEVQISDETLEAVRTARPNLAIQIR